jgi:hypothetical protein
MPKLNKIEKEVSNVLLKDLRKLIDSARQSVAVTVNSTMTILYWQVGKRIKVEILNEERAEYGKKIIKGLAEHLTLK